MVKSIAVEGKEDIHCVMLEVASGVELSFVTPECSVAELLMCASDEILVELV